jgi:osmotically-inducible protein OsmY
MKKYIFYTGLLLTTLTLPGCAIVALGAAGAATTAAVINDQRSLQTITDDKNIEFTAADRISKSAALSANSHVTVISFNHAVLLAGQVSTQSIRQQVESLVQSLPKVARVYNQLEVAPPTSATVRSNDAWITTKVKTRMLETKDLHASQIKVITENSRVYLLGIVNHRQAALASDVARRIEGVQRVVTLFEYTYKSSK